MKKIKVQTLDMEIRSLLGWDRKTEDFYETTTETLGDFLKEVTDKDGRTCFDRFMDDSDVLGKYGTIFFNYMYFLKREQLCCPIKDGDTVMLMRGIAGIVGA